MQANIDLIKSGLSVSEETIQALYQRFDQFNQDWNQRG
jgi:hypothetical protein